MSTFTVTVDDKAVQQALATLAGKDVYKRQSAT